MSRHRVRGERVWITATLSSVQVITAVTSPPSLPTNITFIYFTETHEWVFLWFTLTFRAEVMIFIRSEVMILKSGWIISLWLWFCLICWSVQQPIMNQSGLKKLLLSGAPEVSLTWAEGGAVMETEQIYISDEYWNSDNVCVSVVGRRTSGTVALWFQSRFDVD